MPLPTLETLTAGLDRACAQVLGDTIQYRAAGGEYAPIKAHVNYRDMAQAFEAAQAIAQDIMVTLPKTDVPAKPGAADRLTLPRVPGATFKPINVRSDESGTHWEFEVVKVANV